MPGKVALVTGITGQDGSYLAEFLLAKGYEVHCCSMGPGAACTLESSAATRERRIRAIAARR